MGKKEKEQQKNKSVQNKSGTYRRVCSAMRGDRATGEEAASQALNKAVTMWLHSGLIRCEFFPP